MRNLLFLLIATFCFAVNTFADIASGKSGSGKKVIDWVISDDGTLTVSKATKDANGNAIDATGVMPDYNMTSTMSPWYDFRTQIKKIVISEGITAIGKYAFYRCSAKYVVFPENTLTTIGECAFRECSNLTDFTLPESVTTIGTGAFRQCKLLTSFTFPKNVTKINGTTLYYCDALSSITIPEGVTEIGNQAFEHTIIKNITLPTTLTKLGDWVFLSCTKINTAIVIPKSVTSIGKNPFYGASGFVQVELGNPNYVSVDSVLFDKNKTKLITYSRGKKDETYTVPSTVKVIEERAFYNTSPKTLILPENLEKINARAFYDMKNLTGLTIPAKVTTLGGGFITNCSSIVIDDLRVHEDNTNFRIIDGVIFSHDTTTLYTYPMSKTCAEYIIPSKVTSLASYAFAYTKVDSVKFAKDTTGYNITSINGDCFLGSKLVKIDLPESITTIGSEVFYNCEKLTKVTLPSGLTALPYRTFRGCKALETVVLPDKITRFGAIANDDNNDGEQFYDCPNLKSIVLPPYLKRVSYNAFGKCTSLVKIEIPYSVTSIAYNAFQGCSKLESVEMGPNVTRMEMQAFNNCSSLVEVRINREEAPDIKGDTFTGIHKTNGEYDAKLYIPCNSEENYLNKKSSDTGENVYARTFDISSAIPTNFNKLTVETSDPLAGTAEIIKQATCLKCPVIKATANPGYVFRNWNGDGDELNAAEYTIQGFDHDMTFVAYFELVDYYLRYYDAEEDKYKVVDPASMKIPFDKGAVKVEKGSYNLNNNVPLAFEYAPGCELKRLTVKGLETGNTIEVLEDYTFTMPEEDVVIDAEFGFIEHSITINEAENGSVSVYNNDELVHSAHLGETLTIIATPTDAEKYVLAGVEVTYNEGTSVNVFAVPGDQNQKRFTMPNGSVTITPSFEKIDYTIPVQGTFEFGNFLYTVTNLNPNTVSVAARTPEITGNLTILQKVSFKDIEYEVVSISENGFLNPDINLYIDRTEPMPLGQNAIGLGVNVYVPCGSKAAYVEYGYPYAENIFSITDYQYSVTAKVEAGAHGTAKVVRQPDCDDHSAVIKAEPAEGYAFGKWNGEITDAEYLIESVTEPMTFTASFKAIDYTIEKLGTTNGSFNVNAPTANIGQTISITNIQPNEGYELDKIEVKTAGEVSVDVNTGATPTFTMPASNVSVAVSFKAKHFSVTVNNPENGTVSSDNSNPAFGETVSLTVKPSTGYKLKSLVVKNHDTNSDITYSADYKFDMPAANVDVTALFEEETYSITVNVTGDKVGNDVKGTVKIAESAKFNSQVTLVVTIEDDHYKYDIHSNDVTIDANGKFTMPAKNVTISVAFSEDKPFLKDDEFPLGDFIFTITDVNNFKVSVKQAKELSGDVVIPTLVPWKNQDFEVTTVAANGFATSTSITSVTIRSDVALALGDNAFASTKLPLLQIPCGASNSYTTAGYDAYFTEIKELYEGFTITVSSSDQNMGSAVVTRQPDCATNPIVDAIANPGYVFTGWSDNEIAAHYQITNFNSNMNLVAYFEQKTYRINAASYSNGSVSVKGTMLSEPSVIVDAILNEQITVTAVPDQGYYLSSIHATDKVSGNEVSVVDGVFSVPDGDVEITVVFAPYDYNITVSSLDNGVIEPEKYVANISERVRLSIKPALGYRLKENSLTITDKEGGHYESTYSNEKFTMPAVDVNVYAEFEAIAYSIKVANSDKGSVQASDEKANIGNTITLSVTPDGGYELLSLVVNTKTGTTNVDLTEVVAGSEYTFNMPAEDVEVVSEFAVKKYDIEVDANMTNGTVTPSATKAAEDETVTLLVEPAKGYKLASLMVATESAPGVNIYDEDEEQFSMPAEKVIISAEFVEDKQPTSVGEQKAAAIKAYGVSRAIVVVVSEPTDIRVVDIAGREVFSQQSAEGRLTIPANRGIYFVRYKGGVKEVIVR